MNSIKILIVNDDGYKAKGLKVLVKIVKALNLNYMVFAPEKDLSGISHSLSLRKTISVKKINENELVVRGTPVDAILIALHGRMLPFKPELIISGINKGFNLGEDTIYSGTLAAAREGFLYGISSLCFSIGNRGKITQWESASFYTEKIIKYVIKNFKSFGTIFWNINIPNLPLNKVKGVKWTFLGKRHYLNPVEIIKKGEKFKIGGKLKLHPEKGGDVEAILQGFTSITPLSIYGCDENELKKWRKKKIV